MVFLSSRISPFMSTVILRLRSPFATAVVTSAMLRTCAVRFDAIELTLSVKSFQVPPTPGTCAWPPSLPSVPTSRATRLTSPANAFSWSTMVLMVFLSSRISPFTSTVIFFDKSPRATAVVTSAMLRTWPVRLVAIAFTLSVRSFQVPATPFTLAWPPSLPSVPTSRATRVTSEAKEASCSTIVLATLPMRRNSPRKGRPSISTVIDWERSPLATAPITRATSAVGWTMSSISSLTERTALSHPPRAFFTRPRWVILPSLPTTLESRSNSWVISSFSETTSLKRLAISPSRPSTSSGKRTEKSPRRSARSALTSWRRSIKSRGAWMFTQLSVWLFSPHPGCTKRSPPAAIRHIIKGYGFRFMKILPRPVRVCGTTPSFHVRNDNRDVLFPAQRLLSRIVAHIEPLFDHSCDLGGGVALAEGESGQRHCQPLGRIREQAPDLGDDPL